MERASDMHKETVNVAAKKGERVSTKKSDEELQNKIDNLNYNIQQIYKTTENMDELKAMSEDKQLKCEKSAALIETLARNLELVI